MEKQSLKKNIIISLGFIAILSAGIHNIARGKTGLAVDMAFSLIALVCIYFLYDRLKMNLTGLTFAAILLFMHNLYFYGTTIYYVRYDMIMHFWSGVTIALIADRYYHEYLSKEKRMLLLVVFSFGLGAVFEMMEWTSYNFFGQGPGLFFLGKGDAGEGPWHNAMRDLVFDGAGAVFYCLIVHIRSKGSSE